MILRKFAGATPARLQMCESPIFGQTESLPDDAVDDTGIRFSSGGLHHLTDEPAGEFRFRLRLFDLVGIGGDDRIHRALDRARVGHLLQAPLFDNPARVAWFAPQDIGKVLGDLSRDRAGSDHLHDRAVRFGGNGPGCNRETGAIEAAEILVVQPVRGRLGLGAEADHLLEIIRGLLFRNQNQRVISREALLHEARLLLVRQFGKRLADLLDPAFLELQWKQVGIGEIAIVVFVFLEAHVSRLALLRIEEPRLLPDGSALLDDVDLAARLVLDGLRDKAHGIDVLDLASRAERTAGPAHRDVDVGAHGALFHVAVAGPEIADDGPELPEKRRRLLARAHIGFGHDLHQRDARAIEIDERMFGPLVVEHLAGILLEMQTFDANRRAFAAGKIDRHRTFADDGLLVLRDLIAGGKVRIEVVLSVEDA